MPASATVIGTGYVGLITGVCLAHAGHDVCCVDIDADKVARLRAGEPPIHEPGLAEMLREGIDAGRLTFETPEKGWAGLIRDVVFVAVGTPPTPSGAADLSTVRAVVTELAAAATSPFALVMKSTVPPGTGDRLAAQALAGASVPIAYVSNPEFLREGHAIHDTLHPDRIVLGGEDPTALDAVAALYSDIDAPVVRTGTASAETIKYASNAFLSTKISFINEIANVCDRVGADIDDVAGGIGLDRRIGPDFLHAGIGYGGSCFPKDTRALDAISMLHGYEFLLLKSVIEVNARQRILPVSRLEEELGGLSGRTVAVLGLTFKPDTDDTREAPALEIVGLLAEEGATVRVADPMAPALDLPATRCASALEALAGADAAVLTTEWPEFTGIDWAAAAKVMAPGAIVFDGRNALDRDAVRAAGLRYLGVGRPEPGRASHGRG